MCLNKIYLQDTKALNDLFDKLNKIFFESTLSKPVITIQHDRKARALGWFTPWESWRAGENGATEINMSANFLDRDPLEKAETLLHEMCHLYAYQNKIKDHARSGSYHNKRFKEIAESHGLIVEKSTQYGYAHTRLSDDAKAIIEPLTSNIQSLRRIEPIRKGKSSSTRKYICPECEQSVRATKEVNIICGDCDVRMVTNEDINEIVLGEVA